MLNLLLSITLAAPVKCAAASMSYHPGNPPQVWSASPIRVPSPEHVGFVSGYVKARDSLQNWKSGW